MPVIRDVKNMYSSAPNDQYNTATPDSLAWRIIGYQRRRMYNEFLSQAQVRPEDKILDVGATPDLSFASSNYFDQWYQYKNKITACGLDDASFLEKEFPGLRFVQGNGLQLPFASRSFDIVHSSAVLEHVGSFENQTLFLSECCRVARKAVFLTTPNRHFPIEVHTRIPLLHWLPKPLFRKIIRKMGYSFFAEESNLNLLTRREFKIAVKTIPDFAFRISSIGLFGWPSNLLLVGWRRHE